MTKSIVTGYDLPVSKSSPKVPLIGLNSTKTTKSSVPVKEPNPWALSPGELSKAVPTNPVLKVESTT